MSLGEAAEFYSKLNLIKFREITDNIIYLGLPNFHSMNKKEIRKKRKFEIEV